MILVDSLIATTGDTVVVKVRVRSDYPFLAESDAKTIGAWIGIEFIAQAAAVLSGLAQYQCGVSVKPGFLLGTRKYISHVAYFHPGDELLISLQRDFQSEQGLAAVNACISDMQGKKLCEAIITLFQPKELSNPIAKVEHELYSVAANRQDLRNIFLARHADVDSASQ
jgi:predicted hotdog family 3-hydroxylacyl-ACP dehydratase